MNALVKIATITNLVAEIGDCDEVQYSLDGFVKVLTDLKTAMNAPVPKRQNCDECENERQLYSTKCAEHENHLTPPETEVEEDEEEEEEDDLVPCKCNTRMDIRGRCCPVRSAKQFSNCPARFDTAYFSIKNDYEKYKQIEACCSRGEQHSLIFQFCREEPYFLTDEPDLEDEVLELIEQDEENDGDQFCCVSCDGFIPYADEDNGKWCDSEERWVCYSCKDDCFCAECEEYFPDENDLEYLNKEDDNCSKYCGDCIVDKVSDIREQLCDTINDLSHADIMKVLAFVKNL